jgi:predicted ATPase
LAPLADPSLVPPTVAASVGLKLANGALSAEHIAGALSGKELLIVLDTCEHVVDTAATMTEALLRANPAARIIATSREPLRVDGEWVYQVPPLAAPTEDAPDNPLQYGAVRLFLDRARAAEPRFAPNERLMAMIGTICRHLDGIPLAIELAAARSAALGIEELAARLEDRFAVLTAGRRTALPRHQTLRATLDWSYGLLAEPERLILRRLAVFAGPFGLEAASAVAANTDVTATEVIDGLSTLVAKSLVAADVDRATARYRLLDTTRAYAQEKLAGSGELGAVARRHAEYYRDLFERAETEWEARPTPEWLADYTHQIDDLRPALDWAFSPDGDDAVGVALTAAAVPLWMHLSLVEECRRRTVRALAVLQSDVNQDARRAMKLHAALGEALLYARDTTLVEIGAVWETALAIAERLDDAEYQLRSLWGLSFLNLGMGRLRDTLNLAERFCGVAAKQRDRNDQLIGEQAIGITKFYLGDHAGARRHVERVLAEYVTPLHRSHVIRFHLDQRARAAGSLGRILWLQGYPDQALDTLCRCVKDTRETNHAASLCYLLAMAACPVALLAGDLAVAEDYVETLLDHSKRHVLRLWHAWGRSHQGVLVIKNGDPLTGLQLLRAGLTETGEVPSAVRHMNFVPELAAALGRCGQIDQALGAIEDAIEQSERTDERWLIAELLRTKGELLLLQGASDAGSVAENQFGHALDWARKQGALSWELRAATSLARLLRDQGRFADAASVLRPVYDRFTEGFGTADLKAAKALLDALR